MRLTTAVALTLIALLVLSSLGLYLYQQAEPMLSSPDTPTSELLQRVNDRERIQFLFTHEKNNELKLVYLISYESISGRFAAIYLPPETKILSPNWGGLFSLRKLHRRFDDPVELKRELEASLDLNVPYWIETNQGDLRKIVDFLGGVEINFPNQPRTGADASSQSNRRWMDGVQVQNYANSAYKKYRAQGRRFRHKTFFLGLVNWTKKHSHISRDPRSRNFLSRVLNTNLSESDFLTIAHLMDKLKPNKVKFPGTDHLLKRSGGGVSLDEKPLKNMLPKPLKKIIEESKPQDVIEVQVLNGAGVSGLAGTVRDKLQPNPRIDVVEVGNADRYDYETTRIIDRSNNPKSAAYIKDLLKAGSVESNPSKKLLVDVTIILGKDLKGLIYE
ncbi:MAG: LCP family protein [bacterium]